jgi:signal transduction histidine kinase
VGQSLFAPRFLARLNATGLQYENPRVERVLAVSRVCLGATALGVDLFRPLAPNPYNELLIFLLLLYCVENLGLLIWMIMNPDPGALFVRIMQVSDVFWPIALCLFADPPSTLVFVFFLFALMTTAYRYGVYETVMVAAGCTLILLVQEVVVALGPKGLSQLFYTQLGASRLILRCAFLIMAGFLLGYLAEREKELRAEIGFANHLLSLTRVGNRLNEVIGEIFHELAGVFQAKEAYALVSHAVSGRLFRWELRESSALGCEVREILAQEEGCPLMPEYPHTFCMQRLKNGKTSMDAVDDEGRRVDSPDLDDLPMPLDGRTCVLGVKLELGREWNGRFVLVNGRLGWNRERELRFVQTALRQVAPALYSIYLFRRLRSRAGAMERARVARELHDTAIQSLIGIEMQVDVLRRRTNGHLPGSELERIQQLLREEVLNLRELMLSMKPVEVGPKQFLDFIAQLVERFRNDTGLDVRFVSELEEVTLPASACRELVRIVQEGLINIRKHSRAKSVYVRFGAQSGLWKLVIDDDGQGFPFSGRLTLGELDDLHRGPAVIKERIRSIGGDLVIESSPGHGSRLEITVPQKGYEYYG